MVGNGLNTNSISSLPLASSPSLPPGQSLVKIIEWLLYVKIISTLSYLMLMEKNEKEDRKALLLPLFLPLRKQSIAKGPRGW